MLTSLIDFSKRRRSLSDAERQSSRHYCVLSNFRFATEVRHFQIQFQSHFRGLSQNYCNIIGKQFSEESYFPFRVITPVLQTAFSRPASYSLSDFCNDLIPNSQKLDDFSTQVTQEHLLLLMNCHRTNQNIWSVKLWENCRAK